MEMSLDIRNKLLDGLLTPLTMVLISLLIALLIRPVEILFQRPGLLIYTVVLLAFAIVALERCVVPRYPDYIRAWAGMVSGMVTWYVIEMSNFIGGKGVASETGMISMMLVGLVVGVLWRKVMPMGVKFFSVALLGGWVSHLGLYYIGLLIGLNANQSVISAYPILGVGLGGISLIILVWLFSQAQSRLARLWGALGLWICLMLLIYLFNGTIF
jgi:hypothetical protein